MRARLSVSGRSRGVLWLARSQEELRAFAAERLPRHMIPKAAFACPCHAAAVQGERSAESHVTCNDRQLLEILVWLWLAGVLHLAGTSPSKRSIKKISRDPVGLRGARDVRSKSQRA